MGITQDLISTLEEMTSEDYYLFEALMEDLSEEDEALYKIDNVVAQKLKEFDTDKDRIGKAALYYIGFKHGMEEGIRIKELELKGEINVT